MLATPESAGFAERRFRGRPLAVIPDAGVLAEVLDGSRARSVTFCGRWPQLTVGISRKLAEWANRDGARGCGVYPAGQPASAATPCRPVDLGCVYEIGAGQEATEHRPDGRREISVDDLVARLLEPQLAAPTGLVLTGHGAEYCIRLGTMWLSTFTTAMLADPVALPSVHLGSVVFLNCCSSLRLGDSCVPEPYSLALALSRLGSAVIGSFRNFHTSPLLGQCFARALLEGESLGRVVNRLNDQARSPMFQLLGDPAVAYPATSLARRVRRSARPRSRDVESVALRLKIAEAARLEQATASLARWLASDADRPHSHRLARSVNRAALAVNAARMIELASEDLALVAEDLERALDDGRRELLSTLVRFVQEQGWIQGAYAPNCRRKRTVEGRCRRCGELSLRTRYEPLTSYLSSVDREECDCCGTTAEWIGGPLELGSLTLRQQAGSLLIAMPALPARSCGLVLFHRMRDFAPLPWREQGDLACVPHARLSFRGRLTLVGAVVGPDRLTLQYHTFFLEPERDELHGSPPADCDEARSPQEAP